MNGDSHVNGLEGFWARLKLAIRGTHVHVSRKHLPKYVKEFEYRYNRRKRPDRFSAIWWRTSSHHRLKKSVEAAPRLSAVCWSAAAQPPRDLVPKPFPKIASAGRQCSARPRHAGRSDARRLASSSLRSFAQGPLYSMNKRRPPDRNGGLGNMPMVTDRACINGMSRFLPIPHEFAPSAPPPK